MAEDIREGPEEITQPVDFSAVHHSGERQPPDCQIRAKDILCGLHHEYSWEMPHNAR